MSTYRISAAVAFPPPARSFLLTLSFCVVILVLIWMTATHDASSSPSSSSHTRSTADSLRVLHDVLIREEWFAERPPLALAFAHPLTRLYCEMWRAECCESLDCCDTTAASYYTGDAATQEYGDGRDWPAPFISVGRSHVRNPAAPDDLPARGAAGITRPAMTSPTAVFAQSPFVSPTRGHACSLVAPITSVDALGAAPPRAEEEQNLQRPPRNTPVVNPSAPLYSLETYTEKILKLPIGMKLGYIRLVTMALPVAEGGSAGGGAVQLVRGFFSHVPAAVSLSAAHRAAAAIRAAEAARERRAASQELTAELASLAPVIESDSEGESPLREGNTTSSTQETVAAHATVAEAEEDDWETSALLEEAQLERPPGLASAPLTITLGGTCASAASRETRTSASNGGEAKKPNVRESSLKAPVNVHGGGPVSAARHLPFHVALKDAPYTAQLSATCAVLDAAAAVLPPPSAWWLRRALDGGAGRDSPRVPLFVHCVEATKQWVDWVDELQRLPQHTKSVAQGEATSAPHPVDVRGVSLSGWSSAYVPQSLAFDTNLVAQRGSISFRIEDALPRSLPIRGLHLESTVSAVGTLLSRGGGGDCGEKAATWNDTLVALDLPYLRDTDAEAHATAEPPNGEHANVHTSLDSSLLAHALFTQLHQLRFCSLNRSNATRHHANSLGKPEEACYGDGNDASDDLRLHRRRSRSATQPLEELMLFGVADVTAQTLSLASRRCTFLRVVDLSSTTLTDADLTAFVFATLSTDASNHDTRVSPLVWLEELRLAACHSLSRVAALAALPRLRRLTLQASGVRELEDLAGCYALEEVTLTRCEHISRLHPLWRLPRLRCVEADSVRSLRHEDGLLPLPPPYATTTTFSTMDLDESLFEAPVRRLNLAQAALVHGTAVARLAALLRDVGGRIHGLAVLVLDHTSINDDTIEALVGASASATHPRIGGSAKSVAGGAVGLRELSIAGCRGVHHLGPLGLLPQLRSVVADGAAVEQLDGLQRSCSLTFLSVAHCTRLWSIAALAHVAPLRTLDVSRTPLNDAGLLRFVFPMLVDAVVAQQVHGGPAAAASALAAFADALTATSINDSSLATEMVPSQVEELRLYQCTALRYVGCLAHLPKLRHLDMSHAVVFDRGFVGFFAQPAVLLRTQLWTTSSSSMLPSAGEAAASWADEEAGRGAARRESEVAMAPMPDEVALLRAWRHARRNRHLLSPLSPTSRAAKMTTAGTDTARSPGEDGFFFHGGAAATLTHLSLAYCTEVRGIAPCALFSALASLDVTGTAVDSAVLLTFVNLLHECCSADGERGEESTDEDVCVQLEIDKDGLRACVQPGVVREEPANSAPPRRRGIARRPYTLTSLTLSFCHYVTDVRCCATIPSLRRLALCGTPIDNSSIEALAALPCGGGAAAAAVPSTVVRRWWEQHQCALQSLDIRYCRHVTDVAPLLQAPDLFIDDALSCAFPGTLQELHVGHSGVTLSKEELHALNPHLHCLLTVQ